MYNKETKHECKNIITGDEDKKNYKYDMNVWNAVVMN
jgi:hypothetical protein